MNSETNQQRVALVTGGTRGIGLGIATSLANEGWRLAINGMRPADVVTEPLHDLRKRSPAVTYHRGSVAVAADRDRIVSEIETDHGHIDLLVNNAGITSPGRKDILEATEESFDQVMGVNLKGPYFLTQRVAQTMIGSRKSGHVGPMSVVNISSVSASVASVNRGDYCISRAGVSMSTRLWASRLAEFGISVYEIRPGIIRTDMTAGVTEKYDQMIADGLTLEKRWGEPNDVATVVAAMARGDLPYATGNVINVDGGLTIWRL